MPISQDNTRILITISKELKEKLVIIAKKEGRSISNLCSKIISDYTKGKEE
ncbi:MAG: DNA-binding protein [Clostridia bacterium]|nr:DNA-binding protein [Clostridia bacterium]